MCKHVLTLFVGLAFFGGSQPGSVAVAVAAAPTTRPAGNKSDGIVGAWRTSVGMLDATYQFNDDGTFSLTFTPTTKADRTAVRGMPQTRPGNAPATTTAGGTWRMEGKRLVMTNTRSDTPLTVVGEREDAEVVRVDANELVLRTTDARRKVEDVRFERRTAFRKAARDDVRVVGTWRGDQGTMVLANSGMVAMLGTKGEWSQSGSRLAIKLTGRPSDPRMGGRPVPSLDFDFTIDLVNDTTLVVTGDWIGGQGQTLIFVRAK
jgi:hypothetical protein